MAAYKGAVPLSKPELLRRKSLYRKEGRIEGAVQNLDLRRRDNGVPSRSSSWIPILEPFWRRRKECFTESSVLVEQIPVDALVVVGAIPVFSNQVPARLFLSPAIRSNNKRQKSKYCSANYDRCFHSSSCLSETKMS